MEIRYTKNAVKFLNRLDRKSVTRIRKAIDGLLLSPPQGDIKRMEGFSDGRMRLRVGEWRILYRFTQDNRIEVLLILDIGNRGDIYK